MKSEQTAPTTIDAYIADFSPDVQEILQKVRATIREAAPSAEETIKYQLPTFTLKGNLVYFGGFKSMLVSIRCLQALRLMPKIWLPIKQAKAPFSFPMTNPSPMI